MINKATMNAWRNKVKPRENDKSDFTLIFIVEIKYVRPKGKGFHFWKVDTRNWSGLDAGVTRNRFIYMYSNQEGSTAITRAGTRKPAWGDWYVEVSDGSKQGDELLSSNAGAGRYHE